MSSSTEKTVTKVYLVIFEDCHYDPDQIQVFYDLDEAEIYRLVLIAKFRTKHDVKVIEKKIALAVENITVSLNGSDE